MHALDGLRHLHDVGRVRRLRHPNVRGLLAPGGLRRERRAELNTRPPDAREQRPQIHPTHVHGSIPDGNLGGEHVAKSRNMAGRRWMRKTREVAREEVEPTSYPPRRRNSVGLLEFRDGELCNIATKRQSRLRSAASHWPPGQHISPAPAPGMSHGSGGPNLASFGKAPQVRLEPCGGPSRGRPSVGGAADLSNRAIGRAGLLVAPSEHLSGSGAGGCRSARPDAPTCTIQDKTRPQR